MTCSESAVMTKQVISSVWLTWYFSSSRVSDQIRRLLSWFVLICMRKTRCFFVCYLIHFQTSFLEDPFSPYSKFHVVGNRQCLVRSLNRLQNCAILSEPNMWDPIAIRRHNSSWVHHHHESTNGRGVRLESCLQQTKLKSPHHHRLVLTSARDKFSIWRKVNARDESGVALKSLR